MLLGEVADDHPDKGDVAARHCIRTGNFERALWWLDALRARDPADLSRWSLTELLWRKTGDARAEWLSIRSGLVAAAPLGLHADELDALAELLRSLHRTSGRPIGQSARGGTQTRGALFDRDDALIGQLRNRIQSALDTYRAALPAADASHPLLAHRDRRLKAAGGWSIRLTASGFHVAHLHSSGLVSSACSIVAPPHRPRPERGVSRARPPP
ncbi:MAG: hypothetical protein M3Q57_06405 [Pseudomonadota bacterium]|nr:hypothetical protein [Pseudomonadota bacterium]